MTDNELIKQFIKRIKYLEIVVGELMYLANCQGHKFDHLFRNSENDNSETV